jgi:hypothetical protein
MTLQQVFERTVFLLGAGASRNAGCLMSSNMLKELETDIIAIAQDDEVYGPYKDGFLELFKVIKPSLSFQAEYKRISSKQPIHFEPNIEDYILILRKIINKDLIVPEPLVGSWNEKLLLLEIKHPNIFNQYLNFIYDRLVHWLIPADYSNAEELLRPITTLLQENTSEDFFINVFTLNYDLVYEKIFNKDGTRPLNNGFANNQWTGSFDTEQTKINLYKLHGSLDWYSKEDDTRCNDNYDVAFNPLNPDERKPHLILGYETKLFSVDPFFTLLQNFIEKLEDANLVISIGYSFFDAYLNNLLIKFLNGSDSKKLLIIDPAFAGKENPDEYFTNYIKLIQSDSSSMSIGNYSVLPTSKINFFKSKDNRSNGAAEFYQEYFSNKCEKLMSEYRVIEEKDKPF